MWIGEKTNPFNIFLLGLGCTIIWASQSLHWGWGDPYKFQAGQSGNGSLCGDVAHFARLDSMCL